MNAYAVLSSPRTSGNEAIVISASWLSRIDEATTSSPGRSGETINIRGVATVMALAKFLRGYSLWAKDLVFVIGDGHLDGMHAWLSAYHGVSQPSAYLACSRITFKLTQFRADMNADYLELTSGVIWTALNIDYPGHSFSHLGVFFGLWYTHFSQRMLTGAVTEGLNGRLPNQDLLNSLHVIAQRARVPVVTYDHISPPELPNSLPSFLRESQKFKQYTESARNVLRHVGYEAKGGGSGVHGLLHQYVCPSKMLFPGSLYYSTHRLQVQNRCHNNLCDPRHRSTRISRYRGSRRINAAHGK